MQPDNSTPHGLIADGYHTVEDTLAVLQREDLLAAELDDEGHALWGSQHGDSTSTAQRNDAWEMHSKATGDAPPTLGNCRPESIFRRVAVRLVPIFFCIALLCQMFQDLQWSKSVYGLGSGLFFIGYALFQLPSNLCCMVIGAPRWLAIIVATWGAVACLFATLRSKAQFYVLRLLLGMTEAGAYPAMYHHMLHFFSDQELGVAYTFTASATALAGLVGGPIAAGCLCMDGLGGLAGWQWLFLLEGIPTIVFGLSIPFILLRNIAMARFLTPDERCWLLQRQQRALRRKLERNQRANKAHAAFLEWRVYYLSAAWFLMASCQDALVFWVPQIIHASLRGPFSNQATNDDPEEAAMERCGLFGSGRGAAKVAMLATVPYTTAALIMIAVSMSSKRCQERHFHAAVPTVIAAIVLGILPWVLQEVGFSGAYAMLIMGAAGVWGSHGPLLSWPSLFLDGPAASTGFAVIKTIGAFGSFLGSYLVGVVTEWYGNDFGPALWLMSGQLALCALLMVCFPEPGPGGALAPPWWAPGLADGAKGSIRWVTGRMQRRGSNGGLGISLVKQLPQDEVPQESPVDQVVPHA